MSAVLADPPVVDSCPALSEIHLEFSGRTATGRRRDTNEDAWYVSPNRDLFMVADGMGGHAAGEWASRTVIHVLRDELAPSMCVERGDPRKSGTACEHLEPHVRRALRRANSAVLELGRGDPWLRGAGTTIVLAMRDGNRLAVTSVGDSRAYLVRDGDLTRLTADHSWIEMLIQTGQIRWDQARRHPLRNVLYSHVGMEQFASELDVRVLDLLSGDRLLLCSDGLTDHVDDRTLLAVLAGNDPDHAAEELIRAAQEADSEDDITCVVLAVDGG